MIVRDPETGMQVHVRRDSREGRVEIIIYTDDFEPDCEWPGSRIPKLCVRVNEEDEGVRINSNGKWVGENIASPLEQLAGQAK